VPKTSCSRLVVVVKQELVAARQTHDDSIYSVNGRQNISCKVVPFYVVFGLLPETLLKRPATLEHHRQHRTDGGEFGVEGSPIGRNIRCSLLLPGYRGLSVSLYRICLSFCWLQASAVLKRTNRSRCMFLGCGLV